jgi:predicted ribosome quality control (RQC) complex YloA/Tae2 family protein
MSKKSLAGLEIAAMINELQFLTKGKVSQIYHQEREFLLQLHAPGEGKQLLKIVPGKYLCLTKTKDAPLKPSSFCMQLRKHLGNAFIKSISQKDSERIIVFELEKKETYFLIIELFSKGNVVLTNSKYEIVGLLEQQEWKDRSVRVGKKYIFPASGVNWKEITEKELSTILKKSEKKNLATSLAIELGLGGVYAEELCKKAEVDKNKDMGNFSEQEVKSLVRALKDFMKKMENPKGYIYLDQITPFPLIGEKETKKTSNYSEAVDTLNPYEIVSPYEKRIKALERRIQEQGDAIISQEKKIKANTKKGELIYEKYSPLQKLLDIVKEMKKTKDWKEISVELNKEKKIKAVDLKNKRVVIDL